MKAIFEELEIERLAIEAKEHLEKYPYSICEIRVEKENLERAKQITEKVTGEILIKRINFLPKI